MANVMNPARRVPRRAVLAGLAAAASGAVTAPLLAGPAAAGQPARQRPLGGLGAA